MQEEIICDEDATDKSKMYYREFTYEEPMDEELYVVRYEGDPLDPRMYPRYPVSMSKYEELYKFEVLFVEKCHVACSKLRNYICTALLVPLERSEKYMQAKEDGRLDVMIKIAMDTVLKSGTAMVIGQGNNKVREHLFRLFNMKKTNDRWYGYM